MKTSIFLTAILAVTSRLSSGALTLEDISPHFTSKTEFVWEASTNHLRKEYWIFKRRPQLFSQTVISNAIVLASLQEHGIPKPSGRGTLWDFNNCPCGHRPTFSIVPVDGIISYVLPGFRNGSQDDLPGNDLVGERAWKCASGLGLHEKDLSPRTIAMAFCDYDINGRLVTNNSCGRRISLARRIDDVEFQNDSEGFSIEFGSHGQIRSFTLVWPKLERSKKRRTAAPDQIIACLKAFKTPVAPKDDEADYFSRIRTLAKARKVTITRITPYYADEVFGQSAEELHPNRPKFATPFAELKVVAELENTSMDALLYAPILVTEVNRILSAR